MMRYVSILRVFIALLFVVSVFGCDQLDTIIDAGGPATPKDPATTPVVPVDRFSESAAHLMVRTAENGMPAPNAPVNFDQGPFVTQGLSADGRVVRYYNFDVQSRAAAPIYVLFREGADSPVEGQLNVINAIPGEPGYNDFWHVQKVTVGTAYVPNTITSFDEIAALNLPMEPTPIIVNCPVVPDGSTATARWNGGNSGLVSGWYKGMIVKYFVFEESSLMSVEGRVAVSPIYVTFNINPGEVGGGPPSGFVTETGTNQTHNVIATVPGDAGYSPLWMVNIYNNAAFASVSDLASATAAELLVPGAADVNCPVVFRQ